MTIQKVSTYAAFVLVLGLWLIAVLLWRMWQARRKQLVDQRLGLGEAVGPTRQLRLWHDGKEAITRVPDLSFRPTLSQRLERTRQDAGFQVPLQTLVLMLVGLAGLTAMVTLVISGSAVLSLIGVLAVILVFWIYVKHRSSKRQELFDRQLVDSLDLAARSLRAGHPLMGAFRLIAEEIDPPVGSVFAKICQQQTLGVSLEEALRSEAAVSGSDDLKLFATSVVIQIRSGGNLASMMERLSAVISDRMRLNRQVRILIAQTQLSKRILMALPIIVLGIISLLKPDYLIPLFSTSEGRIMLITAGALLLVGSWSMNRLARLPF